MTNDVIAECPFDKYMSAIEGVIASDFGNLPFNGRYRDFPKNIVVLGCGGTGSWFAPKLVKMVNDALRKGLINVGGSKMEIVFIDGDDIEDKNLIRQNFIGADVGKNKAEVLASRYGGQFDSAGVRCTYIDKYVNNRKFRKLDSELEDRFIDFAQLNSIVGPRKNVLYINLIDNAITRKIVHLTAIENSRATVIDVANNEYNGQLTSSLYSKGGHLLGSNHGWFYNSVSEQLGSNDDVSVFSCADADADAVDQLFNANDMAATVLGNYINNWIVDKRLTFGRVDFVTGSRMSINGSVPYFDNYLTSIGHADVPANVTTGIARRIIGEICTVAGISVGDIENHGDHCLRQRSEYYNMVKDSLCVSRD